jgi:hypothetical protein
LKVEPSQTSTSPLTAEGAELQAKLEEAANTLREELKLLPEKIVTLALDQPPTGLLGYVWAKVFSSVVLEQSKNRRKAPAEKIPNFEIYQFVLEYLHAIWSGNAGPYPVGNVDETKAEALLTLFDEFYTKTMHYCITSSSADHGASLGVGSDELGCQAKTTWVLLRGHRHQVLEQEFFSFALAPHDEALRAAYGVGAVEIAAAIQRITNAFRAGHARAAEMLMERWQQTRERVTTKSISMEGAIQELQAEDPKYSAEAQRGLMDLFCGGTCNVSKQSSLPVPLLQDMGYEPGEEKKFFEPGPFAGTPFRTLPARIRPLIRLGDEYYATDGQFVRDTAYRAIQRGLIGRNGSYRETWNKRQKELTEQAFPTILAKQLKGATLFGEIYFKDADGHWPETDMVGWLDDSLFIVEAKAGVMAMHSPETDFDRHMRAVQDLVVKAYKQCRRFVEYLASAPEAPIFQRKDGQYSEVARVKFANFRKVFPIGLTIEAFTPFSAMCKRLAEIQPLVGKHPFISMSVDDLFVLNRFLPTAGMLFHYLTVRQEVAGMRDATMFDEQDHLGAYVGRNRFDRDMREQLEKHDLVTWDGFSDRIDSYFMGEDWESKQAPQQEFPGELTQILDALDRFRPSQWLKYDSDLRDLSGSSRKNFASVVRKLLPTLAEHPIRRFLFPDIPLHVFLHRVDHPVPDHEIVHRGEVACLISRKPTVGVLSLAYDANGEAVGAQSREVRSPPIIRADYGALAAGAERERARVIKLEPGEAKPTERLSKRARRRNRGKGR